MGLQLSTLTAMPMSRWARFLLLVVTLAACQATNLAVPPESDDPAGSAGGDALLVFGDWGAGNEAQELVAAAMSEFASDQPVAAILTTGDNFYSDDVRQLLEPLRWTTDGGIPLWLTWGNHDVESPTRLANIRTAFHPDPPAWAFYQWGGVEILVLDSNQIGSDPQIGFIEERIEASDLPMIVAFHHPVYTCSPRGGTSEALRDWVPLFDDDVVLVLNGHDHNYQRFHDDGVTYVVTGGGGRSLNSIDDCGKAQPDLLRGKMAHHFVVLEQSASTLLLQAIDVNGTVIDRTEIALGNT